jgi:hypothetical protein
MFLSLETLLLYYSGICFLMGVVDAKERVVLSFAEWNSRGPPACKLDDAESQ